MPRRRARAARSRRPPRNVLQQTGPLRPGLRLGGVDSGRSLAVSASRRDGERAGGCASLIHPTRTAVVGSAAGIASLVVVGRISAAHPQQPRVMDDRCDTGGSSGLAEFMKSWQMRFAYLPYAYSGRWLCWRDRVARGRRADKRSASAAASRHGRALRCPSLAIPEDARRSDCGGTGPRRKPSCPQPSNPSTNTSVGRCSSSTISALAPAPSWGTISTR